MLEKQSLVIHAGALAGVALVTAIALVAYPLELLVLGIAVIVAVLVVLIRKERIALPTYQGTSNDPILWAYRIIPTGIGLAQQDRHLSWFVLGSCVLACLTISRKEVRRLTTVLPVIFLLMLGAWSWVLNPSNGSFIIFAGSVLCVLNAISSSRLNRREVAWAAIDGLGIFLLASVLLYYGFGLRSTGPSLLATNTGIPWLGERTVFPLSGGFTTPTFVAAAYLAACVARVRWEPIRQHRHLAFVPAALIVIVASNGRLALLLTAGVGLVAYARPSVLAKLLPALCILGLCLPLWLPIIADPVGSAAHTVVGAFPGFDRGAGVADSLTLNGRTLIWSKVVAAFAEFPTRERMLGWGANGHVTSQVSQRYAPGRKARFTAHNSLLQVALEVGVVGAALFLSCVVHLCRKAKLIGETDPAVRATLTTAFAVILLSGVTEATLAPGPSTETFWLFLLVGGAVCGHSAKARPSSPKQPEPVNAKLTGESN